MVFGTRKARGRLLSATLGAALLLVCFVALSAAQNVQFKHAEAIEEQRVCNAAEDSCDGSQMLEDANTHWLSSLRQRLAKSATTIATTVLPIRDLNYSPMNVQPPTSSPSFRGWFMRLMDHERKTTVVVLVGAFTANHNLLRNSQHYLFVAVDATGDEQSGVGDLVWNITAFPAAEDVQMYSEDPGARACNVFWRSEKYGTVQILNDTAFVDLRFGQNHVQVKMTSRVPYSVRNDLGGPEGWLTHSSLLPSRYYVHSIGSHGSYHANLEEQNTDLSGSGLVHLETNYGRAFPLAWTWIQACTPGSTPIAAGLVGGEMPVGPLAPMLWGVMVVWGDERLEYRTTDFDMLHYSFDSASKTVEVFAMPPIGRRHELVHVTATAPPDSFGDPMFIPTVLGFTDKPGCVESYRSTVRVRVYRKIWFYKPAEDDATTHAQLLNNISVLPDDIAPTQLYKGPSSSRTQLLFGFGGPEGGSLSARPATPASATDAALLDMATVATQGWVLVGDQVMQQAAVEFGGDFQTRKGKSPEFDYFRAKWTDTQTYNLAQDFRRIKWRAHALQHVEQFTEPRLLLLQNRKH